MSLKEFILSSPGLKNADEIVFFGGSFNPWHQGHSACVELLPKDKTLIVLPDHNPYKELVNSDGGSPERIKKIVSKLHPNSLVFDEFFKANKKNPTFFWMEDLSHAIPNKDYSLLVGFDTFTGIDQWIEAKKLLSLLKRIYVASRQDNPSVKETQTKKLKFLAPNLEIKFLGGHPFEDVSSTELRKKLTSS